MGTEAISPLRQRIIEDMNSRKLGAHTQRSHIYSCKRFAAFLERSPDTATLEDIRLFQLHLAETVMMRLRLQMLMPVSAKCSWNRRMSSRVAVSGERSRNAANRLQL